MLLIGASTSNKLQVVTSASADIEVSVSGIVTDTSSPPVVQGGDFISDPLPSITSPATTDIVVGAASKIKRIGHLSFRNSHASLACGVTVQHVDGTDTSTIIKVTLTAGETLLFTGAHWIHYDTEGAPHGAAQKMNAMLRVVSDVVNATTSFADVTGLTINLLSGRKYAFEAMLFHQTNATTTGAQFGVNIGATPTLLNLSAQQQITASVTAATFGSSAMVTAVETAAVVETTGPGAVNMMAYLAGFIQPSADGTLAIRCKSEVAVASGLTVKAGSWLRVRECDN